MSRSSSARTRSCRPRGKLPERATLRVVAPAGEELEEYRARLATLVADREREFQGAVALSRRVFLGLRALLAQSHEARAKSFERKFELNPAIACKNRTRRVLEIFAWKAFVRDYREALRKSIRGSRDVLFPFGT